MKNLAIATTAICTILTSNLAIVSCSSAKTPKTVAPKQLTEVSPSSPMTQTDDALEQGELVVQGLNRTFYIHTPPSYSSTKSMPLLLVFHGSNGTGRTVARVTGFNEVADREGFVVVYPNGIDRHWHDARDIFNVNVDDISFTKALIDYLKQTKNIDSRRIYATGMSNGAVFTQTLACRLSDQIAAFASVAGSLPPSLQNNCKATRPVPIMMVNGTDDPIIHYEGGSVGRQGIRGELVSIPGTVEFWRRQNNASVQASRQANLDINSNPQLQVARYTGGQPGSEVVLVTIQGGKHAWPDGDYVESRQKPKRGNVSISGINATQLIWDFFKQHSLN